ncbi:MAG: hypothetical protein BWY45_01572 [Euryarchaeota archaeon ADurb.Bin294]|nr:MAG: hypothetical protein BWY45_01572 [Euryarchaeota archaeon ADurb.Bin294]
MVTIFAGKKLNHASEEKEPVLVNRFPMTIML